MKIIKVLTLAFVLFFSTCAFSSDAPDGGGDSTNGEGDLTSTFWEGVVSVSKFALKHKKEIGLVAAGVIPPTLAWWRCSSSKNKKDAEIATLERELKKEKENSSGWEEKHRSLQSELLVSQKQCIEWQQKNEKFLSGKLEESLKMQQKE